MNLKNKNILISGANAGIGMAACLLFAKEQSNLIAIDIAEKINEELGLKLATLGASYKYFSCDVSKPEQVNEVISTISAEFKIDVLVNNAGILGPNLKTENYPVEDFDRVIDVNVKGVYYVLRAALPIMAAHGGGSVINTASVAGHVGMAGHIAYSASKHAVMGMTKTVALEYAKNNIRVNAVCPGFTQTAMLETAQVNADYLNMLKFATPMKRFGEPSEIASAMVFLASDASSFMTGQCIILDGGLTTQ